jgi:hypothetical protein
MMDCWGIASHWDMVTAARSLDDRFTRELELIGAWDGICGGKKPLDTLGFRCEDLQIGCEGLDVR